MWNRTAVFFGGVVRKRTIVCCQVPGNKYEHNYECLPCDRYCGRYIFSSWPYRFSKPCSARLSERLLSQLSFETLREKRWPCTQSQLLTPSNRFFLEFHINAAGGDCVKKNTVVNFKT